MNTENKITYITGLPHNLSLDGKNYIVDKESEEWKKYKQGLDYQTEQWLLGNPITNKWHDNPDYWESCPDFSNEGAEIWPYELRVKFIKASEEVQTEMCMMSLGGVISEKIPDLNIHLPGIQNTNNTVN